MKPTSPLSLLLFLTLTTAAPTPLSSKFPKDCLHYTTCTPWLREIFSSAPAFLSDRKNDHTPPTRLSPHFPAHQLSPPSSSTEAHREIEAEFNNAPIHPPPSQKPSAALSGGRPLPSNYLLSLANPATKNPPQAEPQSTSSADAMPSKPTSALPKLREEDTVRYWATITSERPISFARKESKDIVIVSDGLSRISKCADYAGLAYLRGQPMLLAREYSDLLVVGIVVLFLAGVVILEGIEYCGDLRSAICGRSRQRRGTIFLKDDECVQWIIKAPFQSQPALVSKHTSPLPLLKGVEADFDLEKMERYHDYNC